MTESIQVKQSMGARAIQEKVYNKPDWVISVPDCQKLRILWSWCWDHWHWQLYYSKKDAKERGEVWSFTKIPLNTVPHFHPLSSTFTHFHPLSPTFTHFHPLWPTFIQFGKRNLQLYFWTIFLPAQCLGCFQRWKLKAPAAEHFSQWGDEGCTTLKAASWES